MSLAIRLAPAEMMQAAMAGVMRQVANLRDGRRDAHGYDRDGWADHVEGACGELAVAKALGMYWPGVGTLRGDDVGRLQVRTRSRDDYELIVHPNDPDDRAFVLVRGRAPAFAVVGWIMGGEAKRQEWWKDPTGKGRWAYFVPDAALREVEELRVKVGRVA